MHIKEFINSISKEDSLFIQPHDFPDPDAIAAAFGLQGLLENFHIHSSIVYAGEIQRDALKKMIQDLNIVLFRSSDLQMDNGSKVIIIDGCKGNKNVTDLAGEEIAVIDHHQVKNPESVFFTDIRSNYGSSCSIISSYYQDLNIEMKKSRATAMLIGLNTDTARMTRGVSDMDLQAYNELFQKADTHYVNTILRNNVELSDLSHFQYALQHMEIIDQSLLCYFPHGCTQNLLGILGDFLLSIKEVKLVFLCAQNDNSILFSIRNESRNLNASFFIQSILQGIGFGGGHEEMAGGIIHNTDQFKKETFFNSVKEKLQNYEL